MKYTILILASSLLLFSACQQKEKESETETVKTTEIKSITEEIPKQAEMCFRQVVTKDTLMLTVLKEGDNISGTYKSIPFEKDKKTIIFKGSINGNTVNAVGTAMGEGTNVREEIVFTIENNKAGVKFGEMIQGDDDVYRYKNLKSATSLYINKVDCP